MDLHQKQMIEQYRILNQYAKKGEVLFTGSSLMEQFPLNELLQSNDMHLVAYNRGISGFTTQNMLNCMEEQVFGTQPSMIFINIGTNDIANPDLDFEESLKGMLINYEEILKQIKDRLPQTEVYVMAYYPVNEIDDFVSEELKMIMFRNRNNRKIAIANGKVENLATEMGYQFIDINDGLYDERGVLRKEYTVEGIHMRANGYQKVIHNLKTYLIKK